MKLIAVFLIVAVFSSCKKTAPENIEYSGTWELEKSTSIAGTTNHPPGNGQIIFLGTAGIFERRVVDTVLYRGRFFLESVKDCEGERKYVIFKTSESNTAYRIYKEREKLVLSSSACYADGGIAWYRRLP